MTASNTSEAITLASLLDDYTPEVATTGSLIEEVPPFNHPSYCAIGWALHSLGVSDEELYERNDACGYSSMAKWLRRFGIRIRWTQVAAIMRRNDAGPYSGAPVRVKQYVHDHHL